MTRHKHDMRTEAARLTRLGIHGPARDELLEATERGYHQSGIVLRQADDARKRAEARIANAIDALTSARMAMSVGDPAAGWVDQAIRALREGK